MNRVFVLGYFGYRTNQLDGQTVKTRDILRLLNKQYPCMKIDFFDTQDIKYKKSSVLLMLKKLCRCNTLIYLPAHNNLKYIFPIVFILSRIFRFDIHYFVVGGWLNSFIRNLPIHRWMLKRVTGIHVETKRLEKDLQTNYGYNNIDIFPNFRFFDYNPTQNQSEVLRLVFMARIMKEKGLDWIFSLADYIENNQLSSKISITFFGQINERDKDYFLKNVARYPFVEYKRALQPEEIYETLSKYDCLLLPTHFFTEGLPGSIVDAYISGIPVIATEWVNAREFIEDGETGFIIPFKDGQSSLIKIVSFLYENRASLKTMKLNVIKARQQFAPPKLKI